MGGRLSIKWWPSLVIYIRSRNPLLFLKIIPVHFEFNFTMIRQSHSIRQVQE